MMRVGAELGARSAEMRATRALLGETAAADEPGARIHRLDRVAERGGCTRRDVDEDERTITVEPENGAEPSTYLFDLVVSDGRTAEVRRTARVTVVESTREKIAVGDAELDATAGEETVVDIGEYVTFNPFEDDGKPVELVSGPTLTAGDATLKANGLQVAITPGEEYFGTLTATYVLRDATGNAVLVDFGLAGRRLRAGCGSAFYGAAEVWMESAAKYEPFPTDVYAAACVAYEVLTNSILMAGDALQKVLDGVTTVEEVLRVTVS